MARGYLVLEIEIRRIMWQALLLIGLLIIIFVIVYKMRESLLKWEEQMEILVVVGVISLISMACVIKEIKIRRTIWKVD